MWPSTFSFSPYSFLSIHSAHPHFSAFLLHHSYHHFLLSLIFLVFLDILVSYLSFAFNIYRLRWLSLWIICLRHAALTSFVCSVETRGFVTETPSLHLFNFTFDSQKKCIKRKWSRLLKKRIWMGHLLVADSSFFLCCDIIPWKKLKTMKKIPPAKKIKDEKFDPSYWNVLSSHQQLLER